MGWVWDQHDWDQQHLATAHEQAERARASVDAGYARVQFHLVPPSTLKGVLLAIADHAGHDGSDAWPSIDRLAEMTELSRRTVQRAIRRLVDLRYITVAYQRGGPAEITDDARPNRYTVLVSRGVSPRHPAAENAIEVDVDAGREPDPGTGCHRDTPRDVTTTPPGCHPDTPRGVTVSRTGCHGDALTVLEPSLPLAAASGGSAGSTPSDDTPTPAGRPRDEIWDALAAVLGHDPATSSERGAWNRACKDLRAVAATSAEIRVRAGRWAQVYPGARLTAPALARHWGELAPPTSPARPRARVVVPCAACDSTGWSTGPGGDVAPCSACQPELVGLGL